MPAPGKDLLLSDEDDEAVPGCLQGLRFRAWRSGFTLNPKTLNPKTLNWVQGFRVLGSVEGEEDQMEG